MTKHLDLGCGDKPRNPYRRTELFGTDIRNISVDGVTEIKKADLLAERIPFADNFFDSLSAYDFLEHVPRVAVSAHGTRFPFVELMSEVWRVLRPGGMFYALTPAYPHSAAFRDPTHVNIITRETHGYFCGPTLLARMYGFSGEFECVRVVPASGGKYDYEPDLTLKFMDRFRYNRRERRGEHSHLVWEMKAVKPAK